MWYLILSYLMNPGNPTMPIQPTDPNIMVTQSVDNPDADSDDPVYGDNGNVRPPRPKK
ncbi:hypothetical protein PZ892_10870 [Sphingobacterium sp. WM]|uniref:hypothetical protein n=1 Tax=Sphingobacterium sp. WM TaxID=3031802 RepID=UPI00240D03EF|nr:hypothetical protein [Sphingobacterium sp. WM]WFB62183.1 hypothetical protein PZ892_10870 [Sphingobacterium sp. WM]